MRKFYRTLLLFFAQFFLLFVLIVYSANLDKWVNSCQDKISEIENDDIIKTNVSFFNATKLHSLKEKLTNLLIELRHFCKYVHNMHTLFDQRLEKLLERAIAYCEQPREAISARGIFASFRNQEKNSDRLIPEICAIISRFRAEFNTFVIEIMLENIKRDKRMTKKEENVAILKEEMHKILEFLKKNIKDVFCDPSLIERAKEDAEKWLKQIEGREKEGINKEKEREKGREREWLDEKEEREKEGINKAKEREKGGQNETDKREKERLDEKEERKVQRMLRSIANAFVVKAKLGILTSEMLIKAPTNEIKSDALNPIAFFCKFKENLKQIEKDGTKVLTDQAEKMRFYDQLKILTATARGLTNEVKVMIKKHFSLLTTFVSETMKKLPEESKISKFVENINIICENVLIAVHSIETANSEIDKSVKGIKALANDKLEKKDKNKVTIAITELLKLIEKEKIQFLNEFNLMDEETKVY